MKPNVKFNITITPNTEKVYGKNLFRRKKSNEIWEKNISQGSTDRPSEV